VVVFVGPRGLGPWQQRESYRALDRQTAGPSIRVIPVFLPGTQDPALGFLGLNTWVDLRRGIEDPQLLERLVRAIRGEAPGDPGATSDPRTDICPYRGLLAFREEDAAFFFRREGFVRALVECVATRDLVAVVGASGSGKSSVVRAGLVPALRRSDFYTELVRRRDLNDRLQDVVVQVGPPSRPRATWLPCRCANATGAIPRPGTYGLSTRRAGRSWRDCGPNAVCGTSNSSRVAKRW
jgi:hypothetical protein